MPPKGWKKQDKVVSPSISKESDEPQDEAAEVKRWSEVIATTVQWRDQS